MTAQPIQPFQQTTAQLIDFLSAQNGESLNRKPFNGGWSAAQIGEHILKSYAVVQTLKGNTKPSERPADQKVPLIKKLFLDFDIKMQSPKAIVPSEHFISKDTLLQGLKTQIEELTEIIKTQDLTVTCLDFAIPEYGYFTRLEWIWFTMFHTQRHIHQLNTLHYIVAN
ncbi:DinB family protein [Pedobacter heparinus]|uniref:DinB family protein n=1 Tax=Pedobacter heparinus TaxID=984 RepID=UPI002931A22A|nr:DinB family protein [Pedobacter heparinus]